MSSNSVPMRQAKLWPHALQIPVGILCLPSLVCVSHGCVAAYNCLRPVLLGWYFCGVMVVSSAGNQHIAWTCESEMILPLSHCVCTAAGDKDILQAFANATFICSISPKFIFLFFCIVTIMLLGSCRLFRVGHFPFFIVTVQVFYVHGSGKDPACSLTRRLWGYC